MRARSVVVGLAVAVLLPAAVPAGVLAATNVFRSAFAESFASNATGIATGDFDGDGTTDAVTTNAGSANELNVVLNFFNDGTISPTGQIPLASLPSALAIGRFDADAIDDLVVGFANENSIAFLHGRKDNDYFDAPSATIDVGGSPAALAVVDFNGDGKLDLIAGNDAGDSAPGSVSFLRGDGLGGFTLVLQDDPANPGMTIDALPTELGTRAVAVGNIDGDAQLEVLALNSRDNSISIFDGDGSGAFTPGGSLATALAPQDLRLVDVSGDGKLDLIVANGNEDDVSVRFGNGDHTFAAAQNYAVGTAPNRVALGDLDDNGTLDIVTTNSRSGDVTLLRGDGMGGFGDARTFVADAEPQVLALDDFNADGLLDVVAAAQGGGVGGSINLLRNRGDANLHAIEDVPAGNGPTGLAVADLDDDGLPDLISSGDGGEVLIQSATAAGFQVLNSVDIGGRALAVLAVDLNGDTRPDLAAVDNDNDRVVVALATASGFGALQNYSVSVAPTAITAGDFNGDGRVDLAVAAIGDSGPGRAAVLLQNANGSFGPSRSTTVDLTPIGIAAIDGNCDGKDDLVVTNLESETVSVLRSNGDGTFSIPQTIQPQEAGGGPVGIAVADFNRDGVGDFAVSNSVTPGSSPSVRIFAGHCDGPFTLGSTVNAGSLVKALVARDFTGDGLVDIGLVNQTDNALRLLTGRGDGTMRNSGSEAVSRMPIAIGAGDFDGDGRYDAATANSDPSANNISVAFNCVRDEGCAPFPLPTPIPGAAALRGDGNADGVPTAADLVAVGREVMDNDGFPVEQINVVVNDVPLNPTGYAASAGVDANGDGLVTAQDRRAVAHRIFGGA